MRKIVPIKLKNFIRFAGPRFLVLYLLTMALLWPFADYPAAMTQAHSSAINRFLPNFNDLLRFRDGEIPLNPQQMHEYLWYFQKVNAYLPQQPDVLALVGYCAYYAGHKIAALNHYRQAVSLFPFSFASQYNLGALYFQKGDYATAIRYLQDALKTDFVINLQYIIASRINLPFFREPDALKKELSAYLKIGYERAYRLLVASYTALKDPENALKYALQALTHPVKDPLFFYYHAGTASAQLGKTTQAIHFLTLYLNQNPQDRPALQALGQTLASIGQKDLAKNALAQAAALPKKDQSTHASVGDIILQLY